MRVTTAILGLVAGLALAIVCSVPVYDLIWPRATDKNQGGVAFFCVLVLAPALMSLGAIAGALFGRWISKNR
jgi:hypothetical protein